MLVCGDPQAMHRAGVAVGAQLQKGDCVALFGDIGAGKTTFVKGVFEGLGGSPDEVVSPTFVYLNLYQARVPVAHFDLYRLPSSQAFLEKGFAEQLHDANAICLIEWPERIESLLPPYTQSLFFSIEGDHRLVRGAHEMD